MERAGETVREREAGADDRTVEVAVRTQLRAYESKFRIEYLSGLATSELDTRLSRLPANSMVYYTVVDKDGAGHVFHPLEYLDHITAVSNAPVYTWVDSGLGHGVGRAEIRVRGCHLGPPVRGRIRSK